MKLSNQAQNIIGYNVAPHTILVIITTFRTSIEVLSRNAFAKYFYYTRQDLSDTNRRRKLHRTPDSGAI